MSYYNYRIFSNLIESNNLNEIKYLLDHENNITFTIEHQYYLLFRALINNNYEIAKYLIEKKCNINSTNYFGNNLFHSLLIFDDINLLNFLIDNGINIYILNNIGETSFHYAINHYDINIYKISIEFIIKLYVSDEKLEIESKIYNTTFTPFEYAAFFGYNKIAKLLLFSGSGFGKYTLSENRKFLYFSTKNMIEDQLMTNQHGFKR